MHVAINGVRLFFDVEGASVVPDGSVMREKPTAAALPAHLVRFERFAGCGHAVLPDAPERALATIRDFIAR